MALDMNPDHINDADRQLKARIAETGTSYAAANNESKKLNKQRAEVRAKIKEMGVRTDAYQTAIHVVKDLTPSEGKVFLTDLKMLVEILGAKQADLFPEEQVRAKKREEKRTAEKASQPRTPAELDAKTNTDPKSDPRKGGAARALLQPDGTAWPDDAEIAAREQAEGGAILESMAPQTEAAKGKKSQSQIAKEKLEGAMAPGKPN